MTHSAAESSTKDFCPPGGELSRPKCIAHRTTDDDTQDKKHRLRPEHNLARRLRSRTKLARWQTTISSSYTALSAFLPASSETFNSLSKILFIFPSWYLFAIGLRPIFSLGYNLPPNLRSNPEERDSSNTCRARRTLDDVQDSHPQ